MTVNVPDRFKAANAFWIGLGKIELTPAAVLGQARMPVTVYDGKKNLVTTAQFFALWRAFFRCRRRSENCHPDRRLKSATVNNGGLLRPRLPRRSRAPCSLQATVYARGTANQNQQRRMLNTARVATRAGGNAAPLDGRRLRVIR